MAFKFKPMSFWTILLIVVPTIFIASVAYAILSNDSKDNAYIVRVVDGDTIDVKLRGKETRVRLLNVDTPETKHPEKTVQCMGPEATEFLENRLPAGTRVQLEYDEEREDPYGRTLAGVYHEDSLLNSEIAARGLGVAVVFKPNEKFYQQVKTAEDEARKKSEGLFDPTLGCSLSSQVENLQKHTSTVTDAVPEDLGEFPAAFEELEALEKAILELSELLEQAALNTTSETSFLAVAFADEITGFKNQLKEQQHSLESHASTLEAHQDQLKEEEQRKEEEEQRRKEEQARQEAEEQHREEREAEQRKQAQPPQTPTVQAPQTPPPSSSTSQNHENSAPTRQQTSPVQSPAPKPKSSGRTQNQPAPSAPSSNDAPAGHGTDADYPGYTGPRCYAPGGRFWRPC